MSYFLEDIANHLADMPALSLIVYPFQFPTDDIECVALFPTAGGVGGNIGVGPTYFSANASKPGALDYPGVQVQVRALSPNAAYAICESIRTWLDMYPPSGYVICKTTRSHPDDLTNTNDLEMAGGPCYRYSVEFSLVKVRE